MTEGAAMPLSVTEAPSLNTVPTKTVMVQNQYQKASMPLDDTIEYQYGDRNKNYMSWYQKQLVWVQHLGP